MKNINPDKTLIICDTFSNDHFPPRACLDTTHQYRHPVHVNTRHQRLQRTEAAVKNLKIFVRRRRLLRDRPPPHRWPTDQQTVGHHRVVAVSRHRASRRAKQRQKEAGDVVAVDGGPHAVGVDEADVVPGIVTTVSLKTNIVSMCRGVCSTIKLYTMIPKQWS